MKLIDGDNLISRFEKASEFFGSDLFPVPYIKQCVIEMPAIEPKSLVKHGWWMDRPEIKSFKYTNIPVVECSECGIIFCDIINNHHFMYHYCPNCGAKMDLEAADET